MDVAQQSTLEPGTVFGSYRVGRLIGVGGMGCVYEATHLGLDKRVALKTIHHAIATENPEAHERFLREGRAAARVKHPHIVDVTDVGVEDGTPYLVMELLEGESLSERIAAGPMSPAAVMDTLLPVMDAIQAAHDAQVVHRDLKPDNIFLARTRRGEEPKIVDFGISKVLTTDVAAALTGTGSLLGTPCYMSPEQTRAAKHVDHQTDIYALGVIAYEMLTGQRAFQQESLFELMVAIVEGDCPPPRAVIDTIPEALDAVVRRAMAIDVEDRFRSAHAMGRALMSFASGRTAALWTPTFGTESADEAGSSYPSGEGDAMASTMVGESAPQMSALSGPSPVEAAATPNTAQPSLNTGELLAPPMRSPARFLGIGALAAVLVLGVGGGAYLAVGSDGEIEETAPQAPAGPAVDPEPQTFEASVEVEPSSAELVLDGETIAGGRLERQLPVDGSSHTIIARADGYASQTITFIDEPPPGRIVLERLPRGVSAPSTVDRPEPEVAVEAPAAPTRRSARRRSRRAATPVPPPVVRPFAPAPRETTAGSGANQAPIFD